MTPENAQEKETSTFPDIINNVIQIEGTKTESNKRILELKDFDPTSNKGVYIIGENQHIISQYVLSVEEDGRVEDIEVFGKCIEDNQKAVIERETYFRCREFGIPTLDFVCSIPTSLGTFNFTKTENYLIPYSRLKINSIRQYQNMLENGLLAIDRIHAIGIQHRDTLTRNIATLSNKAHVSLIFDFETAQLLPKGTSLSEKEKKADREIFLQSLFFQLVKQNPQNRALIKLAEDTQI